MAGSLIELRNRRRPRVRKTFKVNNMMASASKEDSNVEGFLDSQIKGRKRVATIAAGAILTRLLTDPSNSTPREKLDSAHPDCSE